MQLSEAKAFVGKVCAVRYRDRAGSEHYIVSKIYDVTYVPLYGGYLVTDTDDIRLDRVCDLCAEAEPVAAPGMTSLTPQPVAEPLAA